MVLDERMGTAEPPVTGRPIAYRRSHAPTRATNTGGEDVLSLVAERDLQAPSPGAVDARFIGLLQQDQVLTLEFGVPIRAHGAVLVADGWIEYPYSQTVFAAWQAGLRYRPASLEARGRDGKWRTVAAEFGYPAGMPRTMTLPLPDLPAGTDALRLSSNMEIYWDRLRVVMEEPLPIAMPPARRPLAARVGRTGFAKRTTGPQRVPHYEYEARAPYWDAKYQRGFYTSFGEAVELISDIDSTVAIIGSGEEIHLEFRAGLPPATGASSPSSFAVGPRTWTSTPNTAIPSRPCLCWTTPTPMRWNGARACTPATTCAFRWAFSAGLNHQRFRYRVVDMCGGVAYSHVMADTCNGLVALRQLTGTDVTLYMES